MKVGYMRVSTFDQSEAMQEDALNAINCEKLFRDVISGVKFERKGLDEALNFLRPGDTFAVWRLDRLGRSLKELIEIVTLLKDRDIEFVSLSDQIDTSTPGGRFMFHVIGALAEYERELIRERTQAGLAAARARGRLGGRPRRITNGKVKQIQMLMADKSITLNEIVEATGVSRSTLYRYRKMSKEEGKQMLCFRCELREGANFSPLCQVCQDQREQEYQKQIAREKGFIYKDEYGKRQFADECATCHRKETVLWIVSFRTTDAVQREARFRLGAGGPVTGVWCEDCIAGMVGKPEIESGLTFTGIHDIKFLKKCYEPPMDHIAQFEKMIVYAPNVDMYDKGKI